MKRLLIANRGEIALRIIRAAKDLGIETVAVYADDDRDAPFARLADHAFGLGAGGPRGTYLDIDKIIAIARRAGADAVHPGYGLLSENADFAQAVIDAGLVWVGPPPAVIAQLGDKLAARALARQVGAPLAAGSDGAVPSAAEAVAVSDRIGFPVAIKASFGGGGRGIRIVRQAAEVADAFAAATREAEQAFGRGDCYIEQFIEHPRHVEVQILADTHGRIAVLGTRDCTLQRRNQKLLEEAPAPTIDTALRMRLETASADICRAAGYQSAGTVEFLVGRNGTATFLEVNTRLQVEHPVTEEIFDTDIVTWQLRIARGEALDPAAFHPRGHAIELRINAEDPGRGFLPTPGRITALRWPEGPGIRIDSGVSAGGTVPAAFDSLIAKIIIRGPDRATCIRRAQRAVAECEIAGIATTLAFHRQVLHDPAFIENEGRALHTRWIEEEMSPLPPAPRVSPVGEDAWQGHIEIDGKLHRVTLPAGLFQGRPVAVQEAPAMNEGALTAPFAATLVKWLLPAGAEVASGSPLAIIEAMKAEHTLVAPRDGVFRPTADAGALLTAGQIIARIG